jgi:hypothetical protein
MAQIHPDDTLGAPQQNISEWMEAAELLGRELGQDLDYAQAYTAFVQAVREEELGEAGEWEGDPTEPEAIDIVASWLQGRLEELVRSVSSGDSPGSQEVPEGDDEDG